MTQNKIIKQLAEQLIMAAGSKNAAHKEIDAAGTTGKAGRKKGTQKYLETDLGVLFTADLLQTEYHHRKQKLSKRRLITQADGLASIFGLTMTEGRITAAAIARVARRQSFARAMIEAIHQNRPDLMKLLPEDALDRLNAVKNDPSKINFGAILFLLFAAQALARRFSTDRQFRGNEF